MPKSLITGINGQDGSYLSEFLIEKGYEVHGILKRNSVAENQTARLDNIYSDVKLHYGDLTDLSSIISIIQKVMPDEILWELPNVELSNKYNELITYCIVAINREGESLDLYGYALGDNLGDSYIFTPYELTANQLCNLADYLK